jgi:hypothetical protein
MGTTQNKLFGGKILVFMKINRQDAWLKVIDEPERDDLCYKSILT